MMEMTNWYVCVRRNWRKLNRQHAQQSENIWKYIIIFVSWKKSVEDLGHNGDNIKKS